MSAFTELPLEHTENSPCLSQSPPFAARPKRHTWLCSSSSSPLLLTQLWLPQLYILQNLLHFSCRNDSFSIFLFPLCYAEIQKPYSLSICFVSSRSERAEGKADGKRWKSKKKEGTMPAQPKCSFIFIINPKCTVKAVAITRGQSFLLIWSASQAPEEPGWHTSQTQLCPGGTAWMSSHTECCAATLLKFFMCVCSSLQMKSSP